ncbi:uncharacterized protein HMPREF1541_00799 [Cyphellophora europaea CBS 101466]|uniref:alpha-1,2-Mannosidase n=1 Tax=Cyphellophora europaea (strain CBS 101466) TaxID=1220924 RepID=W2SF02_CYPE1|nr:uncharacterized protein HMPREF1541_00799 [Cyphellophora europaea CBS 101466]ETN46613.1 hypothetical protein HMPREF1541_00799 [Cyphellophora europaea CBS 101466]
MFRMRRFRLFVLITVILVGSVYELYHLNNWDVPDLESLAGLHGFKNDGPQAPVNPDQGVPVPVPPPAPPASGPPPAEPAAPEQPPPADPKVDAAPPAAKPEEPETPKIESAKPAKPSSSATSTSIAFAAQKTITGEEFLKKQPQDFELSQQDQGRLDVKPWPQDKPKARWHPQSEHFPVQKVIGMPPGEARALPKIQHSFGSESSTTKKDRLMKQTAVREAFKHAWNGYKTYALPHDELKPLSNDTADPFNGWGATLVDSLDTMWMMGLQDEFEEAVGNVTNIDFKTSTRKDLPLFETTIRYLGGLLGAYDISQAKYPILLEKAVELADVIMGAFDTPNRMPIPFYQWAPSYASQPHRSSSHIVMAELGSLAVELTRLSQITKEEKYYDAIARVTDALEEWQDSTSFPGVWPVKLDSSGCKKPNFDSDHSLDGSTAKGNAGGLAKRQMDDAPKQEPKTEKQDKPAAGEVGIEVGIGEEPAESVSHGEDDEDTFSIDCVKQGLAHEPNAKTHVYSIAAMADSTYEYFPKMHALLGGRTPQYRNMYLNSMDTIRKHFLFRPMIKDEKRDVRFLAKQKIRPNPRGNEKKRETDYEGTHLGCFVGGMFALGSKVFDTPSDMEMAEKLTDGCVWAYESTPLGIMAEEFLLTPCADDKDCPWDEKRWHEHLDPNKQERFEAVERYNAQQKALTEGTTPSSEERLDPASKSKRQDMGGSISNPAPSRTLNVEDEHHEDAGYGHAHAADSGAYFIPKVALSHEKYVAARISEERLPPSYTKIKSRAYKLRPEAIESVFIMYRLTGDQKWRDKGWAMFQAVEPAARTGAGHATVRDVTSQLGEVEDTMESFWLAETLKYFWLLFAEEDVLSLDEWVLNTEAHGMRIPKAGQMG